MTLFTAIFDIVGWTVSSFNTFITALINTITSVTTSISNFSQYVGPFGSMLQTVYNIIPDIYTTTFLLTMLFAIILVIVKEYL